MSKKFWLRSHSDPCYDVTSATVIWTIDNFMDLKEENGQSILSPSFRVGHQQNAIEYEETKWQIQLYPGWDPSSPDESVRAGQLDMHLSSSMAPPEMLRKTKLTSVSQLSTIVSTESQRKNSNTKQITRNSFTMRMHVTEKATAFQGTISTETNTKTRYFPGVV